MKICIKLLQGKECTLDVEESTSIGDVKTQVAEQLNIAHNLQRLVYKGKTLADDTTIASAGITDGAKIHLMAKRGEASTSCPTAAQASSVSAASRLPAEGGEATPEADVFSHLSTVLQKQLSPDQTARVVQEFRKNCQTIIDSMNFDDIERFAASNFTEF